MARGDGEGRIVRFGTFEADLETGELRKAGIRIRLQDQPFRILCLLLERPGQLVTREQVCEELWPGNPVIDVDHGLGAAVNKLRAALGDSAQNPRFIETLPRRGFRFIAPVESDRAERGPAPRSLAVLPLSNLRQDPAEDYFCDGMTEALITDLAGIDSLHVISRTSVMPFKNVDAPVAEIARRLNVRHVIEGSVLRERGRVRVTVQLIDAPEDRHIWASTYEGDLDNIIALQNRVAREIAREVSARLSKNDEVRLSAARAISPEVYEACLRGRFQHGLWTNDGLENAARHFLAAIDADPAYAPAYVGLVMTYRDMITLGLRPGSELIPKITAAAEKALELDPDLPDAHYAAGCCHGLAWRWQEAEEELVRAIQLNPGFNNPYHAYTCFVLIPQGRFDEAVTTLRRAMELSPLQLDHKLVLADVQWRRGRPDLALEHAREAQELAPGFPATNLYLGTFLLDMGRYQEAIDATRKAQGTPNIGLSLLAYTCAAAGREREARGVLAEALDLSRKRYVSPFFVSIVYGALGEIDTAMEWLEKGWRLRDMWLMLLAVDPRMKPLRGDPRFRELLRRMGLDSFPLSTST